MDLKTSYTLRGLKSDSYRAYTIQDIKFSKYDLLFVASSWDERCLSITESSLTSVNSVIYLKFDDEDHLGLKDLNTKKLDEYIKNISSDIHEITGQSTDVDRVWGKVLAALVKVYRKYDRPISILCDLSCAPRYYSLSLVATCFKLGLSRTIDCFYNECTYPEKNDSLSLEEVNFTAGKWTAKKIEYLDGNINPASKNRFTVSIGFEGSKTLMVLNEYEPDKLKVLVPAPGFSEEYVDRVRCANSEMYRNFDISENEEIHAYAADPVKVWKRLSDIYLHEKEEFNEYYLCAGSKAHSLGMAFASISLREPALLYSLPEKHNPVKVQAKPDCWIYKIENYVVPIKNDK